MESKRQKKVAKMLQRELGEIFQELSRSNFSGAFITVKHVMISPDLGIAKVYLSFLLHKDKEMLLADIRRQGSLVRQKLGNRIRHQVRSIPELHFYYDDTEDVADSVEKLFEKLDIPPEDENPTDDGTYRD